MKRNLNLLTIRRISLVCLFLSIPTFFISGIFNTLLLYGVGAILFSIYITVSLFIWKCPYCKNRLPMRFNANNVDEVICPHCHGNLLNYRE